MIRMASSVQYVVDEKGNKVAVILPIREYEHLKEDLHDLAMVAERWDEATISITELKKREGKRAPAMIEKKPSFEPIQLKKKISSARITSLKDES